MITNKYGSLLEQPEVNTFTKKFVYLLHSFRHSRYLKHRKKLAYRESLLPWSDFILCLSQLV